MHKRKILAAVALAGAVAAGGSAFTAGNTFAGGATAPKTGYGSTTVTGATINSLVYNLSANGTAVSTTTLELAGDTTASAVFIGYNDGATSSCGTGTYVLLDSSTTYSCPGFGSTADLVKTAVVVN